MNKPIQRRGKFYVYLVRCKYGAYYCGYTKDIDKRIKEHNGKGGAKYLKGKTPVTLMYCKEYKYYKNAINAEVRIKLMTRPLKEALIKKWDTLNFKKVNV